MKNKEGMIGVRFLVALGVLAGAVVALGWTLGALSEWRTEGVRLETTASAQYSDAQNYLSNYTAGFYEQLGIGEFKSDKLDRIVSDYVQGRAAGEGDKAGFVNAVVEAAPDIGKLDVLDKMFDYVSAGREGFRNKQSILRDTTRSYESWLNEGLIRPWILKRVLGFPTNTLKAQVGTNITTGRAALDKMNQLVLTSDTLKAYETGVSEPLKVPPVSPKK